MVAVAGKFPRDRDREGEKVPEPIPGLEPLRARGTGAPTDRGLKPAEGGLKVTAVRDLGGVLVPASIVTGALATGVESPVTAKAIHIISGFKAPPIGGEAVPTPFAAVFLLPQPIGMLPERFFQSKPVIPGTGIYVDPLYNVDRLTTRIGDERRAAAQLAQTRGLNELLPDLTDDELRRILLNQNNERAAVAFIDPRALDSILLTELHARKAESDTQGSVASFAAERAGELLRGAPLAAILEQEAQLRGSSAAGFDPAGRVVAVVDVPRPRVSPLDPFGVPVASSSLQTESIQPVNAAALANERAATGIRRQLVSERADP